MCGMPRWEKSRTPSKNRMRQHPHILIVEDEAAIAEMIAVNLRHNGFTPILATNGEMAQRELDASVPDLILLDWMLPGESGIVLARKWRSDLRTRTLPIVMLTAHGGERDKVSGLDAGADDYITKPFSVKELLARIRAVMRRRAPEKSVKSIRIGELALDKATHRVTHGVRDIRLGPTEFKLLQYFITHVERVHSRSQLLDHVWGEHVIVEERTVDVHIKRLRESLGDASRMVETVRGSGYRFTASSGLAAST